MVPKGKLSKTWMGTCLGPKFVAAVYPTHLSSSFGKTTRSVCSLGKQSVERLGGRTCHLWAIKFVLWFSFPIQFSKNNKDFKISHWLFSHGFYRFIREVLWKYGFTHNCHFHSSSGCQCRNPHAVVSVGATSGYYGGIHSITSFYIALKYCSDLDPSQIDISFLFGWIIDTSKHPPRFTRPSCFVTGPRFSS